MSEKLNNAEAHFDALSDEYSTNYHEKQTGKTFEFNKRKEITLYLISALSPNKILECASGSGDITLDVKKLNPKSKLIINDISNKMLNLTKQRFESEDLQSNTTYKNQDIFDLLDKTACDLDLCLCLGLIAHTGRIQDLLSKINKSLLTEGYIVLQYSRAETYRHQIVRIINKIRQPKTPHQIHYYDEKVVTNALVECDFEIVESKRYLIGIPFINKTFPKLSFIIERVFSNIAETHGSEVIVLARKT